MIRRLVRAVGGVGLLFACGLALAPAPGCSDGGGAASGGGGDAAGDGICSGFCASTVGCVTSTCTLAKAAGADSACADACETARAVIASSDQEAFDACLTCLFLQPVGCHLEVSDACTPVCPQSLLDRVGDVFASTFDAAIGDALLCTNGDDPHGGGTCEASGGSTSCDASCSNGFGAVSVTCDKSGGAFSCTCTQGKNHGFTFEVASCQGLVDDALWTRCNISAQ